MKFAVLASLLASASAFAPAKQAAKSTSLAAFEDALGAQPPVSLRARRADVPYKKALGLTASLPSVWTAWILRSPWFVEQCFRSSFQPSS